MNFITRLEETILISIWKLRSNAYGVTINREVSDLTGKDYTMGSLYFTLDQLFKKGLVNKEAGEPISERGGRSRVFYSLTHKGVEALKDVKELQESIWSKVNFNSFMKPEKE